MLVWVLFMNTRLQLGLHPQEMRMVLNLAAQADSRGATQVLRRGVQAVARGS